MIYQRFFISFFFQHRSRLLWVFLHFSVFSGILKNENGTPEDEENFEEAIKNVNTALNPTKVELLTFEGLQLEFVFLTFDLY